MQTHIDAKPAKEIPSAQRRQAVKPLAQYFRNAARDEAIHSAYREGGYTLTAITGVTGLSISRVSPIIADWEDKAKQGP